VTTAAVLGFTNQSWEDVENEIEFHFQLGQSKCNVLLRGCQEIENGKISRQDAARFAELPKRKSDGQTHRF